MSLKVPIEPSKGSIKKLGIIRGFSANTHPGLVRNYNEDRVAIILNILKPQNMENNDINNNQQWPNASLFAVYDGHGGHKCADYLRDNLHNHLVLMKQYPNNPKKALFNALIHCENMYKQENVKKSEGGKLIVDKSGSCALVCIVMNKKIYIANVGDSRAIVSQQNGQRIIQMSYDHRPDKLEERVRVEKAGGKVYQSQTMINDVRRILFQGPLRVFPGRLSVSRTIGDLEAKIEEVGGNPNVVIPDSSTKVIDITDDTDFVVLGCDGIFDKMTNRQVVQAVYDTQKLNITKNIHEFTARATENILKQSLIQKSLDNVTVVMVSFTNLKRSIFGSKKHNIQPTKQKNLSTKVEEISFIEDNPNECI